MDTIVIGSGFGGIAAALRLRAKGHNVTLIEKHKDLGGLKEWTTEQEVDEESVLDEAAKKAAEKAKKSSLCKIEGKSPLGPPGDQESIRKESASHHFSARRCMRSYLSGSNFRLRNRQKVMIFELLKHTADQEQNVLINVCWVTENDYNCLSALSWV